MVLDPVSILGAAGAAVQFTDFTWHVLAKTARLYRHKQEDASRHDLTTVTNNLLDLSNKIKRNLVEAGSEDSSLVRLCTASSNTATELINALKALETESGPLFWKCFRTALSVVWNEKKIKDFQQRVDEFRSQIASQLLLRITNLFSNQLSNMSLSDARLRKFEQNMRGFLLELKERAESASPWQRDLVWAIAPLNEKERKRFRFALRDSLKFTEIDFRENQILNPHPHTFEWILQPPSQESRVFWPSFVDWIFSDSTLYWIAGKPASGKSTMMKFLCQDDRVAQMLNAWGEDYPVHRFSFYFWNSGSDLQTSQEGLLRTIMTQALTDLPELSEMVFRSKFEAFTLSGQLPLANWSWTDLTRGFRAILLEITKTQKVALFIDGLDEFKGCPMTLIEFINSIRGPNVKICVTSRPRVEFEDEFVAEPSLRLEELTRPDVELYINEKFEAQRNFSSTRSLYPVETAKLLKDISDKASGVFLWVVLVTQSLLTGFSGGEKISDLQRRLEDLPENLGMLFENILHTLNPEQYTRGSQYFQIQAAATQPLNLFHFFLADEDNNSMLFQRRLSWTNPDELEYMADQIQRRLNVNTLGLLEVVKPKDTPLYLGRVQYLHRTVQDFVHRKAIWSKFVIAGDHFNAHRQLAQAYIVALKTLNPDALGDSLDAKSRIIQHYYDIQVSAALHHSFLADPDGEVDQVRLLDEVNYAAQLVHNHIRGNDQYNYWGSKVLELTTVSFCKYHENFLQYATICQFVPYITAKLDDPSANWKEQDLNLLLFLALKYTTPQQTKAKLCFNHTSRNLDTISLLLEKGADPDALDPSNPAHRRQTIRQRFANDPEVYNLLRMARKGILPTLSSSLKRSLSLRRGSFSSSTISTNKFDTWNTVIS